MVRGVTIALQTTTTDLFAKEVSKVNLKKLTILENRSILGT